MKFNKQKVRTLLLAAVLPAIPAVSAEAAITHRYSFNDGTANDSVGGANGTLQNGATVASGALVLANNGTTNIEAAGDANKQYVDLPNNVAKTSAVTIEGFTTWGGGGDWQRIFDFGSNTSGELGPGTPSGGYSGLNYFLLTPRSGDGAQRYLTETVIGPENARVGQRTGRLEEFPRTGEHAFAVTKSGNTSTLYLDGAQVAQRTDATNDTALTDQLNAWIGRSNWSGDPFYNGTINEFRIYDNALPADAVAFNAAQGPDGAIAIPEPASAVALLGIGGAALLRRRRTE